MRRAETSRGRGRFPILIFRRIVKFVDMGGTVMPLSRATGDWMETEFVCIPRPIERSDGADGGPILYRVKYRAKLWSGSEQPELEGQVLEGDPRFSI